MLAVDLAEAEHLAVCEAAAQLCRKVLQILDLFRRECQPLATVILLKIGYVLDRVGSMVYLENILVQTAIEPLQHLVVSSILTLHGEILLYALQAADVHILGYLHRGGAPGSYHLAARPDKPSFNLLLVGFLGARKKPLKGIDSLLWLVINCLNCNDATSVASEEQYFHLSYFVAANLAKYVILRCDL